MNSWNTYNYAETVKSIAQDAIGLYPDDEDNRHEYVTETVDGSQYIIYYAANETVLEASRNEPDGAEVQAMSGPDADWRQMRTVAAYLAMEADVMQEIERLIEEREEADEVPA